MNLLFSSLAAASNVTNGTNVTHTCSAQTETVVVADYVLAACAVVVLAFDIWQLVRLLMISRETGLAYNGKRVFHAVLGVSLAGRAVFFFVAPSWCSFQSEASEQLFVWSNHTLEVLFFCAFFLLLIFWMELISSLRREPSRSAARCQKVLLGVFVSGLVAMALIFLVMLLAWAKTSDQVLLLDLVFAGLVNLLEILAAVMFCIFGFILYRLLRKHDQLLTVNVQKKKQMARNIFIVTLLCTLCFSFRVIVSVYSIFQEFNGTGLRGFDVPPAIFFLYFFLPEIAGSVLMLVLLRIPRREAPKSINNIQNYTRIV